MTIPKYPADFHDCTRDKKVTEEELNSKINAEIQTMIEFMKKNDTVNHSKSFDDVLIIIDRIYEYEEYYYEISVAKQHARAIVR